MEYRITSLKEYVKAILEIQQNDREIWFRGHTSVNFRLEPSLHRHKKLIRPITEKLRDFKLTRGDVIMPNEWALKDEFRKLYELNYSEKKIEDLECLFLMQHYGIYTRLLDFSKDPRIALYFALTKYKIKVPLLIEQNEMPLMDYDEAEFDAAVYCIDPLTINDEAHGFEEVIELDRNWISYLEKMMPPLAINTNFQDKRIIAQKGVFVLFGTMIKDLESFYWEKKHINKIIIPNKYLENIYLELRLSGLLHFSIYPDFTGKVMDLNEDMINKMNISYNDLIQGVSYYNL